MFYRVAARNVPKSAFPKLRDLTSGILVSVWAEIWHTGVFGHGEFENDVEI
jgi:hypothetical protein